MAPLLLYNKNYVIICIWSLVLGTNSYIERKTHYKQINTLQNGSHFISGEKKNAIKIFRSLISKTIKLVMVRNFDENFWVLLTKKKIE